MGNLSNYAENKVLDHVLKVATFTRPTHLFVGLVTAVVVDTDTGSIIKEPSSGSYARVQFDNWVTAAARASANSAAITFPELTGSIGTIKGFAILDTATLATGNVIAYGAVTPNRAFTTGDTPAFAAGELDLSWNSGAMSNYLANKLLDHVLKGTAYTPPANIYVALSTATIVDADTGSTLSEPGENYGRINHNTWKPAAAGASFNSGAITFAAATGGTWGTINYFAITDHLTTGNVLNFAACTTPKQYLIGDVAKFNEGDFDITCD